jgi:hypothetical protein
MSLQSIFETNGFFRGYASQSPWRFALGQAISTGAWINDAKGAFDGIFSYFLTATAAVIGLGEGVEFFQGLMINAQAMALVKNRSIPFKAEALQSRQYVLAGTGHRPGLIKVIDADFPEAMLFMGIQITAKCCNQGAEM